MHLSRGPACGGVLRALDAHRVEGAGLEAIRAAFEIELYRELAAEEREHVQLLATELRRWLAGKPGPL
jgi:hypothetical protein